VTILRWWRAVLVAVLVVAGPLACADDDPQTVSVVEAWATIPTEGGVGAVFLTLAGGQQDDRLVGASVPAEVADRVELHRAIVAGTEDELAPDGDVEDGRFAMRSVGAIDVPAGVPLALHPGTHHLVLLGAGAAQDGSRFELVLDFERAGSMPVQVEVQDR
jgi:periplasmic copper chaperone A